MSCTARGSVLLKSHIVFCQIIQFKSKVVDNHRLIVRFPKKKILIIIRSGDVANPKSIPDTEFFGMICTVLDLNVHVHIYSEIGVIVKYDFSIKVKIRVVYSSRAHSANIQRFFMVVYLQFLRQLYFVRV